MAVRLDALQRLSGTKVSEFGCFLLTRRNRLRDCIDRVGISCSQELGDVVDPVSKTRVILLAASVAVAGTSLWCAGPQQGRVRLEARKSAGQYKRPGWRPLTQA
jgi:hypothetical protein